MKKRKHAEQCVLRTELRPAEYSPHLTHEVRVSQHHTFRISGRTRGVEQGSEVVILGSHRDKVSRPRSKDAVEISFREDSRPRLSSRAKLASPCGSDPPVRF